MAMSSYSVARAKNNLGELIDRALAGEPVVITRRGTPVIEFKPVRSRPRVTAADLQWLREQRSRLPYSDVDAVTLIRQMRDEEWDR
jgi:prevent-host-death family protein